MNITKLEKLAAESFQRGAECETHLGYTADKAGTYVVQIKNKDLTQMIELLREMGSALENLEQVKGRHHTEHAYNKCMDALQKYKEMTK
jgi:hypothetical protein